MTTPMSPKGTIFVVDDDAAVRQALKALLAVEGYAVETFDSAESFLAGFPRPGGLCLLLDVRMPGLSGLDLQRELMRRGSRLPIVIVTGHGDVPMAVTALKAGAVDFIEKPFDKDALLAAVGEATRAVAAQRGGDARRERDEIMAKIEQLTPREREVMDLVVAGHANKVIAHRLSIALRTVEIHRARVMDKTGARNLSELVRMAIRAHGAE
jgi:two-component system, LuxR family, response regulator FixJ